MRDTNPIQYGKVINLQLKYINLNMAFWQEGAQGRNYIDCYYFSFGEFNF